MKSTKLKNKTILDPVFKKTRSYRVFLIFALSFIPYISSLNGDFVFDDAETIINNPIVNGKDSIDQIFYRDYWGQSIRSAISHKSYRPLTTFTFWLNYQFNGTTTFGYHVVNILLHSTISILIYHLVLKLEEVFKTSYDVATMSAIFFAVHPIHTEAVANITGRAELLMTLFSILSIRVYMIQGFSFSYTLLVLFSICSKEQGIMIIPICLSIDFLTAKNRSKREYCFQAFYFLILSFTRFWVNGFQSAKFTKFDNPTAFLDSRIYRVVNYIYLWFYHLYLLVLPTNLCFDYSMGCIPTINSFQDLRFFSPALLLLLLILFIKFWKVCRFSTFVILFGFLSFFPSTNILITVGFTVAERILYLPSIGFCIFCAILYRKVFNHFDKGELIAMSLMVIFASKTFTRSKEWTEEKLLFNKGLEVCPSNAKIHYNLGKILGDNGLIKDAEKNYWNAIKLNPYYEQALNNLGNLLEKAGDSKTAENLLKRAVTLRPSFAIAWMNLGITQMNLNKFQDSEKSFLNSLKLRPDSAHCLFNLGVLYQKTNRELLAMSAWMNATRIEPKHSQSWTNLFVILDHLNMCSEVLYFGPEALNNVPHESSVQMQIGACYAQNNQFKKAEHHILTAIDLRPTSSLYHANLGILYQRMNRKNEAANQYRIALMLDSKNTVARTNLPNVETKYNSTRQRF